MWAIGSVSKQTASGANFFHLFSSVRWPKNVRCLISTRCSWFPGQNLSHHHISCEKIIFMFHTTLNLITVPRKQNPPWQYVSSNESGIVGPASGVMIDILDEMTKQLNFTYVLHLAKASMSLNSTDEFNATVELKMQRCKQNLKKFSLFR